MLTVEIHIRTKFIYTPAMSYESAEAQIQDIKENPPSLIIADEVHKLRKSSSNL